MRKMNMKVLFIALAAIMTSFSGFAQEEGEVVKEFDLGGFGKKLNDKVEANEAASKSEFKVSVPQSKEVREAEKAAKNVVKKLSNSKAKKFQKYYPTAVKQIEEIIAAAPGKKNGYDAIAVNGPGWIEMHEGLKKAFGDGPVAYKKISVPLQYKDYKAVVKESQTKAAKTHWDAGIKVINEGTSYTQKIAGFNDLKKARYLASDEEKESIYSAKAVFETEASVHYAEGMAKYNKAKTFDSKKAAVAYFLKIDKSLFPYKDVNDKMCRLYFEEGEKQAKSDKLYNMKKALNAYAQIEKWTDKDYNGYKAKLTAVKNKGAEMIYSDAVKTATVNSFNNQRIAAKDFKSIEEWIPDYKDAAKKATECEFNSKMFIVVANPDGKMIDAAQYGNALANRAGEYFTTPAMTAKEIKKIRTQSYGSLGAIKHAQQAVDHGLVFVRMIKIDGTSGFSKPGVQKEVEQIEVWFEQDGDSQPVKSSKEEYEEWKKAEELAGKWVGEQTAANAANSKKFFTKKGTLTTYTDEASYGGEILIEIWDCRGEARKVGEMKVPGGASDVIRWQTYSGDPEAKPRLATKRDTPLKSEAELKAEYAASSSPERVIRSQSYKIGGLIKKNVQCKY
jgi:hypothetical protein